MYRRLRLAIAALLLLAAAPLSAQNRAAATGSRAARQDAQRSIPLDKIDADSRNKVSAVINNPSIFRRLPLVVTECDPDLYLFLVKHPEVVVNIWDVMGISKVTLNRVSADTFRASDGAGAQGTVKYCYSTHDTQVIYADGTYEGPTFSRPVRAQCVLLLKSGYIQETNNRYYVTSRMDAFIHIEHVGVELLAKTFQPLVTKSADYNFTETAGFLGSISRTAEVNARGMARLANKLTRVEPELREQLTKLSANVAQKSAERQAAAAAAATQLASRRAGTPLPAKTNR